MSSSNNPRVPRTRSGRPEEGRRRSSDSRRSAQSKDSNTEPTRSLRRTEEEDDAGDDGLFLGFEHRMNTDERRRMRERDRAEAETRTRSTSPSRQSASSSSRGGTSSTAAASTSYSSRYGSRSAHEPANKSSSRRTAYSRELEKRDRQVPRPTRSADDRSHRGEETRRSQVSERPSRRSASSDDGLDASERRRERERERDRDRERDRGDRERDHRERDHRERDRPREPDSTSGRRREDRPPVRNSERYRSKSRDSSILDDNDIERRRRREERDQRRREERDRAGDRPSERPGDRHSDRPSDRPNDRVGDRSVDRSVDRSIDDDEERRRRREERRRRERDMGVGVGDEEERRRRRDERRLREQQRTERRMTDYRSGDDDNSFEHAERDRRRAERRPVDYRSGDEDRFDRSERDRRREERRRLREREQDDDPSVRSDRRRREMDRDRDRGRDRQSGHTRGSDLDDRRSQDKHDLPPGSRRSRSSDIESSTDPSTSTRRNARDRSSREISPHNRRSQSKNRLDVLAELSSRMNTSTTRRADEGEPKAAQEDEEGLIGASPGPSDSSGSESNDSEQPEEEVSSDEEDVIKWTVRVCLINAVDLPFNVVPNIPLCPVVKFGLVKIPLEEVHDGEETEPETSVIARLSNAPKLAIAEQIEKNGILSIPKARVRCTSSKILSKRDNGSMEFNEEMRWDNVKHPKQTALAVELCARAALPPSNMKDGPLAIVEGQTLPVSGAATSTDVGVPELSRGQTWGPASSSGGVRPGVGLPSGSGGDDYDDIFQRAIGKKANNDVPPAGLKRIISEGEPSSTGQGPGGGFGINRLIGINPPKQEPEKTEENEIPDDQDQSSAGIAGMRALWRKGRQQFEQRQAAKRKSSPEEMEAATAAAAVARFLIGGNAEGSENRPLAEAEPNRDKLAAKIQRAESRKRDVFRSSLTIGSDALDAGTGFSSSFAKRQLPQETNARTGDENVALLRPKKRQRVEMTKDMRLGSLVIPLTKLPLEKATEEGKAARIEQWYQLDVHSNTLIPAPTAPRRGLSTASKLAARRNPSVLLEISFSAPEVLDESEDELEIDSEGEKPEQVDALAVELEASGEIGKSFSRRASMDMKKQQKAISAAQEAAKPVDEKKKIDDDPVLAPGVCDFIAVVGAINIGDQSQDNGGKGWVNSHPECAILEQFPPNDEFHAAQKRNVTLNNKSEWFCFPEGCRLWRGAEPPSHTDLNLKRFSASSPPNVASSIAAFDACLNCTTSFSWFVIQSNEKENDFKNTKTYGAVIKFYVPAPPGIDSTQDDFAQGMVGGNPDFHGGKRNTSQAKRLWVPLGILVTANLPIVGTLEAMLLRLCEALASRTGGSLHTSSHRRVQQIIHQDLANLIVNFQKPIPGVLHCSIPFLTGERLHLTVPPPTGLPPLPHGASVTSVCRLLGSEGLNVLLAAVLTECKVLIHSDEISNLAMVAEVITALIYPFVWALPYLPVLPEQMIEFVEAPLSYFIGVPSCSMGEIDESVFCEVVVIDLDNGFASPDYYGEGRRGNIQSKVPTPLPASVASNISKAVFRLLREEEEVEEEYGANNMHGARLLPRLEAESLAEREFRIAVALQICGLVRGYDECLFKVSASQPVFNRDKFLRTAPALFEDRRGNISNTPGGGGGGGTQAQRMLSPRSKRFLSILVNCQHFYQFLETLDRDECAFFNEVMYTFDMNDDKKDDSAVNPLAGYGSARLEEAASHLSKALQKVEDKIPTYRVDRKGKKKRRGGGAWDDEDDGGIEDLIDSNEADHDLGFSDDGNLISSFTSDMLQQLTVDPSGLQKSSSAADDDMTHATEFTENRHQGAMAAQFLAEFEKGNHWHYKRLFDIPINAEEGKSSLVEVREKVKLRDAIGERRYRAWKVAQEQKHVDKDDSGSMFTADIASTEGNTALDLTSLLSQVPVADDSSTSETASLSTFSSFSSQSRKIASTLTPEQQRVQDAKDRDVLRRCLERAYEGGNQRRPTRFARRGSGSGSHSQQGSELFPRRSTSETLAGSDPFLENGRDLIADAEAALRNPSAQKFLISVLSQRSRLENQRKRRTGHDDRGRRGGNQATLSRLELPAFDCLVRLCLAMLDSCLENKNYEAGYNLLTQTQGFCTIQSKDGKPVAKKDSAIEGANLIYMTARISLHPIFAELDLWEGVLQMKLEERERERKEDDSDSKDDVKDADQIDFDTTVSTLYEMLAFGVPSEELARFATCVSEKKGWFATERGHNLLLQARRLSAKRESGNTAAGSTGDLDIMRVEKMRGDRQAGAGGALVGIDEGKLQWKIIGWCHPAAQTPSRSPAPFASDGESKPAATAKVGQNLLNMIGNEQQKEEADADKYMKRSPVTSLAAFGPSIVASGGLDGSVFVAHTIQFSDQNKERENIVRGVRLDWGSSRTTVVGSGSSSMDGEYGVGAVSCLAAAKGAGYRNTALTGSGASFNRDVSSPADEDELLQAMEGCRVVAGTTGGDLRVWSVKEVYAATALAKKGELDSSKSGLSKISHGGEDGGMTSTFTSRPKRGSITEIAAGSAFSRLKVSLRGRALSGHRGGVSCIDVPSHIYRPDALVTGGADGFIKLWSLRSPTGRRTSNDMLSASPSPLFNASNLAGGGSGNESLSQTRTKGSRGGDALSILSGHTGRVLCVKTAWHGDRLLSGGADRTVRIWDLAGAGGNGKCLHELRGHLGWVTQNHYWGPNTIVSASTDRSVALWDARVRRSPLFILRYHKSPVSDLLVGSRTDPLMVSAAADGTVATWDFRTLSGANSETAETTPVTTASPEKQCKAIRTPSATMMHGPTGMSAKQSGSVLLSRGPGIQRRTVMSVGADAVVREWDIASGQTVRHHSSGHGDIVSCFHSLSDNAHGSAVEPGDGASSFAGMITSSWDGTIRMRKLVKKRT